ncbi:TPA: hypothetical protein ACPY5V_000067, partial [Yersinia enterocolitica]
NVCRVTLVVIKGIIVLPSILLLTALLFLRKRQPPRVLYSKCVISNRTIFILKMRHSLQKEIMRQLIDNLLFI